VVNLVALVLQLEKLLNIIGCLDRTFFLGAGQVVPHFLEFLLDLGMPYRIVGKLRF